MIPLPSWIDPEAWDAFVQMRREIKKPLTHRAAVLILKDLTEIRDKEHCPNAALDQSTVCCWRGVWPAKERVIEAKNRPSDYERTKARLDAESQRKGTKPPPELRAVLKRVA